MTVTGIDVSKFTPVERRLFDRFSDGNVPKLNSLGDCMWDELGGIGRIRKAICLLRKKLPSHILILYVSAQDRYHGGGYRMVRRIYSGE